MFLCEQIKPHLCHIHRPIWRQIEGSLENLPLSTERVVVMDCRPTELWYLNLVSYLSKKSSIGGVVFLNFKKKSKHCCCRFALEVSTDSLCFCKSVFALSCTSKFGEIPLLIAHLCNRHNDRKQSKNKILANLNKLKINRYV